MPDRMELPRRIAEGDLEAEQDLFARFTEQIRFKVRIRLKGRASQEDQEDLVCEIQEGLLMSLRKGGYKAESGKTIEAYAAGVTANYIGQYFRKKKKQPEFVCDEGYDLILDDSLDSLIDEERKFKIQHCLDKLKPKYREVLHLRIYEGQTIEEIAEKLNIERRKVSECIYYAFKLFFKEAQKDDYFQYLKPNEM